MWTLRRSAHPVLTDEGGAILSEQTGRWTYLTPTAAAAVMLLLASTSQAEAAKTYATRYGIGAAQATVDVRTVAEALAAQGLARTGTEPARRPGRRWRKGWRP